MSVDHDSSSSESSFLSEDDDISMSTIIPYQFEPKFSWSEEGEHSADEHREQENEILRTNNLDW